MADSTLSIQAFTCSPTVFQYPASINPASSYEPRTTVQSGTESLLGQQRQDVLENVISIWSKMVWVLWVIVADRPVRGIKICYGHLREMDIGWSIEVKLAPVNPPAKELGKENEEKVFPFLSSRFWFLYSFICIDRGLSSFLSFFFLLFLAQSEDVRKYVLKNRTCDKKWKERHQKSS